MSLKSSTFQGIITLNQTIADQLEEYLKLKEAQATAKIYNIFLPNLTLSPSFLAQKQKVYSNGFSQLPALIQTKMGQALLSHHPSVPIEEWKSAKRKTSGAFWEYLEVLEESSTEFFQQIDQGSVDECNVNLILVIKKIKETLFFRLKLLQNALFEMEDQLNHYRTLCKENNTLQLKLKKIILFWKKNLDPALFTHVEKCKKYLEFRYQNFSDRFERYVVFQAKVDQAAAKFEKYQVFSSLDSELKDKCLKIYRLVKLWELNTKAKSLPQREAVKSLRLLINPEKALIYFRCYFLEIQKAMYKLSKQLKSPSSTSLQRQDTANEWGRLIGYRHELHTLGATLTKYRDFLLRTDPNPYVRSRLGFAEWVMGPEPIYTKQMLNLCYEIEGVDSILEEFITNMSKHSTASESIIDETKSDILCLLHEMGQPLMSKPMMKLRAEHLINLIEQLDELTTPDYCIVEFIEQALIKGLKGDWRYQVLFDIPKFHRIFNIHQEIIGEVGDQPHIKRIEKFKHLTNQIEQWIQDNDTPRHADEIECDINDIKAYLQDFLAQIQRVNQPEVERIVAQKLIRAIEHQLLEYRYLFGRFFHRLHDSHPEEKMLRYKFLFVDQYFETIENIIQNWRSNANMSKPSSSK